MNKENEKIIVKQMSKKYCKTENFILLLIKICRDNNVNNIEEKLINYFK